ncbi:Glyoxal oxidase-related protein [Hibiscus syriacus]|uniref:Glyoxal oxidase-related protein n=1 Tax=Hibiscus syriacus TaxID=106335 RepID=A0A6A3BAC6_HIBSY|nr:Glyoxal oxidase-related protein [Hibiscus syriacus]
MEETIVFTNRRKLPHAKNMRVGSSKPHEAFIKSTKEAVFDLTDTEPPVVLNQICQFQHSFSQSSSPIYSLPHSNVTLFSPLQPTAAGGSFYKVALASPPCTCNSFETTVWALMVQTDVWCSSGAVTPDGNLVQAGGFNDGERRVRIFSPCSSRTCDWQEIPNGLTARRWYAPSHILPDGRQIIIGGRRQFNYEFIPKSAAANTFNLQFLLETNDFGAENNLYPFVFLNVDGNLFIFANNRAILLDYVKHKVVKKYPKIPGGDHRSYPSTGSAALLPLNNLKRQLSKLKF